MSPSEQELLEGMGNCYSVCAANFEDTIAMVARARGLDSRKVIQILERLKLEEGNDEGYKRLRMRLPKDFPM